MRVAGHLLVHFTELLFLCSFFLLLLRDQFALILLLAQENVERIKHATRGPGSGKRSRFVNNHARLMRLPNAIMTFSERLEQGTRSP